MSSKLLAFLACAAVLACAPAARAMQFHRVGDTLVMSGPVVSTDLVQLRNHLAGDHGVRLVLLHQSPGGDLWTGYQLGNRLRDEELPIAVSGKCESACGLIFLSGTQRAFSDGRPITETMVGLHGAHSGDTRRPLTELGPRMAYVISSMTDRKYPPDLLKRTVYPRNADDMVYAFHPGRYAADAAKRGIVECLKQPEGGFDCRFVENIDALGIGIITEPQVLTLPDEVKALLQRLS